LDDGGRLASVVRGVVGVVALAVRARRSRSDGGDDDAVLAECFEEPGGVPKVMLADRMGCLKGGVVANVMVPTPDYVRFATHFGFRPDFCEAANPESKGVVEALCRYAQEDLIVPAGQWAAHPM
jgi:transposase